VIVRFVDVGGIVDNHEIKGSDKLLYVFLEKALYEVGPHDNPFPYPTIPSSI
jgi:hypothetical protein